MMRKRKVTNCGSMPGNPCCDQPEQDELNTYQEIVDAFIQTRREYAIRRAEDYASAASLEEAVEWAVMSETFDGKRHPHQYKIRKGRLPEARDKLLSAIPELESCRNFAELIEVVEQKIKPIHGIGELVVYDASTRIGYYLDLYPEMVYLHCGTREGAYALGLGHGRAAIAVEELPAPFHQLTADELEDCLCVYKEALKRIARMS
jgi:hypothetical protein